MVIQNIMYFVLGFLASGLIALMVTPSIWHRAVRLTKARIEAATPMTMAEFRADKDQLRAEFALSTRRLEKNVEALRERLAGQLSDINSKKSELAQLQNERDQQLTIIRELEERESELHSRILDLEKEGANLSQQLRMRDRDLDNKTAELEAVRASNGHFEDHAAEVETLLAALHAERERNNYLEAQARNLLEQLESAQADSSTARSAMSRMRRTLAEQDNERMHANSELTEAEGRIASAESRLNALLNEQNTALDNEQTRSSQLLAEKLSLEAELEELREKVSEVETTILNDWDTERLEQSHLRERLNDIASDVSKLVYAVDGDTSAIAEESLFDRVKKFAGEGLDVEEIAASVSNDTTPVRRPRGNLANRMAALRDLQAR